jgi:hypothetical protein
LFRLIGEAVKAGSLRGEKIFGCKEGKRAVCHIGLFSKRFGFGKNKTGISRGNRR